MPIDQALARFESQKNAYLEDLKTLVRIPSVSFDGFDPSQVRRSAEATAKTSPASSTSESGTSFFIGPIVPLGASVHHRT